MKRLAFFPRLLALVFMISGLTAQTSYVWNGAAGNNWNNPGNWTPSGIPGAGDFVTIGAGTTILSNPVTIAELNFSGGNIMGAALTVTSVFVWSGGRLAENGSAALDSNAVLSISGDVQLRGDFYNYGVVNWGAGNISLWGGAAFYNQGTFNEQLINDRMVSAASGSNQYFYNNGVFNKQTSATVEFTANTTSQVKFDNNGTASVTQGILKLSSAGEDSGSYFIDTAGILEFTPYTRNRLINGPVTGNGIVRFGGVFFQGRAITINDVYDISGKTEFLTNGIVFDTASTVLNIGLRETIMTAVVVEFNSGQPVYIDSLYFSAGLTGNNAGIAGSDTVIINNALQWEGGIMNNGGVTIIEGGALATVTSRVKISRPFINYGLLNWEDGMLQFGSNIVNYGHFLDRITTDRTISHGTGPFTNNGIYSKLGAGVTTISSSFLNNPSSTLEGDQTLIIDGTLSNAGLIYPGSSINNGKLSIESAQPVNLQNNGAVTVKIGGHDAGTEFTQLEIRGTAELDGAINIAVSNGFEPAIGDTFRVMTYYSYTGQFSTINSIGDYSFAAEYHPDHLLLTVASITGTSLGDTDLLPEKFALSQNYPNPFNPFTVISYSLPRAEFVTLTVYDVLGREVKSLVNIRQQAGRYSVRFDVGSLGLTSGIYIYRITAGNYSKVRKMVLLQ